MAAITQRLLRLRPAHGPHPYPLRHFSSSDATPPSESQSLRKPLSFFKPPPPPYPQTSLSRLEYLEEIRRKLSEFRNRPAPYPSPYVSIKELYKKFGAPKNEVPSAAGGAKPPIGPSFGFSLSLIRDGLRNFQSPPARPKVGGGDGLPSILDKEIDNNDDSNVATQFVKMYTFSELRAKLQNLRSEYKGNWFSAHDLKERLAKLRLIEESKDEYFHLDYMSSAEKLKLKPKSHCVSARVQVALLTTKIEHLKAVLHKKDKHSRRRLKKLVERRKKLLKSN